MLGNSLLRCVVKHKEIKVDLLICLMYTNIRLLGERVYVVRCPVHNSHQLVLTSNQGQISVTNHQASDE